MRILIIGPAHPLRGGLAAFNERMAQAFQAAGDTVHIETFSLQYPNFLFPGKTQYSSDPAPKDLSIRVSINAVNPVNWWRVGRRLAAERYDVVLCRFWLPFMGPCLGTILRQIRKNGHSKIIGLIDNIVPHEKRPGDQVLAQYFVRSADAFVVMSRSVERELQAFLAPEQRVAYLAHPIYDSYGARWTPIAAFSKLGLAPEARYILFFGFIRAYKGLDVLFRALADERVRALGLNLIVAGEYYADGAQYEELIEQLDLYEQVILHTEYIPSEVVGAYFGAADMVVQPYKTATQSGITQLAYHFEVPMLVTAVGGLPEVVQDGEAGYVVAPNDPKAVADALVDFYQNERETAFREGVRRRKAEFSWDNLLAGIKDLAESIG